LHPTPYALPPTPYIQHPTPYALRPETLSPKPRVCVCVCVCVCLCAGYIAFFALMLSIGYEVQTHPPEGTQVDWPAILTPHPSEFAKEVSEEEGGELRDRADGGQGMGGGFLRHVSGIAGPRAPSAAGWPLLK
jgi:hypothetical protein